MQHIYLRFSIVDCSTIDESCQPLIILGFRTPTSTSSLPMMPFCIHLTYPFTNSKSIAWKGEYLNQIHDAQIIFNLLSTLELKLMQF